MTDQLEGSMLNTDDIEALFGLDVGKGDQCDHGLTVGRKTIANWRIPNSAHSCGL